MKGFAHALITPMPVSSGFRSWCGKDLRGAPSYPVHYIAADPESVTCEGCKKAMRVALANLRKWVPNLVAGFRPGDKVRVNPESRAEGAEWGVGTVDTVLDEPLGIGIAFQPEDDFKGLSWRRPRDLLLVSAAKDRIDD